MAKKLFFSLEFQGGKETINQLASVELQLAELAKQIREAKKAGNEDVYKELRIKQEELRISTQKLRTELRQQAAEFKAQTYPADSLIGLENQYAKLRLEIRGMSADVRQSAEGIAKIQLAANIKQDVDNLNRSFGDFKSNIGNYVSAIKLGFLDLVTAGLATGGISSAINELGNQFQAGFKDVLTYSGSLADLSANALITGPKLKELEDAAQSLTEIFLPSGAVIKNTATDILEAFKLVGAAKPELLQSKDALEEVTKQVIILAKASGQTLAEATDTLITTMSQFNLPASQAAKTINELAAGSKAGAAETKDVAASLKEFGLVANTSNISVAESVALIELLAEKQLKGSEAGTQLRNILVKLSAPDNLPKDALEGFEKLGVNLKVVSDASLPLEVRLKELSKVQGQTGILAKAFGTENLQAAQILVSGVDAYKNFTTQIESTNTALQQADIQAQSFKQRVANIGIEFQEARKNTVQFLVEALTPLAEGVIIVVKSIAALPQFLRENKEELFALGVALIAFNGQAIAASVNSLRLAAVEKGRAIVTGAVTTAQYLLNAAMSANPIGLVISAVALLTAGFIAVYKRSESFRASINGLGALAKELFNIIKESVASFVEGFDKVKNGDFSGAFKSFVTGVDKINPVGLILNQGKRLGEAFNKGYNDTLKENKSEIKATVNKDINTVVTEKKKFITPLSLKENKDNEKADKEARKSADDAANLAEQQLKRIETIREKIAQLNATTIENGFDKQLADLRNNATKELAKLDDDRRKVEDKIKDQGGKKTNQDSLELSLIEQETEAIKTALDKQRIEIERKRQEALEASREQLKKLQQETLKILNENQVKDLGEQLKEVQAFAASKKVGLEFQLELDKTALNEALTTGSINQSEFNQATKDLQSKFNSDILNLNKSLREEQISIDENYLAKRIEQLNLEKQIALSNIDDVLNDRRKKLADDLKVGKIDQETYNKTITELDNKVNVDKESVLIDFRSKEQQEIQRSKDLQLNANKQIADSNKVISEEKLAQLQKEKETRKLLETSAINAAKIISDGIFEITKTRAENEKEERLKQLDDETTKKLELVKGNATLENAVKKESEKQKLEIEKKAFEENKKRQIAQALINGALAIIQSLANNVLPFPLSLIAPATIALTTGFEIAKIRAQKFAKGGFTGRGLPFIRPDETGKVPVGVVHANEFVANEEQVKRYPALFDFLEADRTNVNFNKQPNLVRNNIFDEKITRVYFDDDQIAHLADKIKESTFEGSKQGTSIGTYSANDNINRSIERQVNFELNNQF